MCLLVLAWQVHPRYRLIVAANRDEYHERPATPLGKWPPPEEILAGRDLRAGGTWLGVDRRRRFGVITNFRELQRPRRSAPSRGGLIPGFLGCAGPAREYLQSIETDAPGYSGFNLLLADERELWYASNRADEFARPLPPGVYGLSNRFLDTPWPKLARVRRRFDAWLGADDAPLHELFDMLGDRTPAGDGEELPQTGVTPEWERVLSAPFIVHPQYGTRCSTVFALEPSGALYLAERRFDPSGQLSGETEYRLNESQWP